MKFQNPSIHRSKVNGCTHRQTDKPKAICPSNFFKVGGIKKLFSFSSAETNVLILLINVKMPTIVCILTFISRINYMFW